MNLEKVIVTFQTSEENKSNATFELVELFVGVGSVVEVGVTLATAETEKATIDIESPFAGKVHEIFMKSNEIYHHGEALCTIEGVASP